MSRPFIILGGGLWGSLLAYRLHSLFPDKKFILYEKGQTLGGNHTWSFFESDLSRSELQWLKPLIVKSWPGYEVSFPAYQRKLDIPYHSITSDHLHQVITSSIPKDWIRFNQFIEPEDAIIQSDFVIDARGISPESMSGFQNFLGLELELEKAHGLSHPLIMDAKVMQKDGFRFLYALPWDEKRLLIEDTRYSSDGVFKDEDYERDISQFLHEKGWEISRVIRKERGSLPIPWEISENRINSLSIIDLSGIFHDTTGYSLPQVVKLLSRIEKKSDLSFTVMNDAVSDLRSELLPNRKFFRMLNLLMFHASGPDERYKMLEYFYTKSDELIRKFYACELSAVDRVKFFLGKPPVSILSAMKTLAAKGIR